MNRTFVAFLTTLANSVVMLVGISWLLAAERAAEPTADANESLDVQYALAYQQLAQTDLQVALEANRKARNTYSEAALEPLRQVVGIAEAQLKHALEGDAYSLHNVHIRQAEAVVAEAEDDLQNALKANRKMPGLMTPTELLRAQLRLKVAKLALAKTKALDPHNASEQIQWQLEELRTELLQLRSRVERLSM